MATEPCTCPECIRRLPKKRDAKQQKPPRPATYTDLFGNKISTNLGARGMHVKIEHFEDASVAACAASEYRLRRLRKVLLAGVAMCDWLLVKLAKGGK